MELIGIVLCAGCAIILGILFYNWVGKELIVSKLWQKTTATVLSIHIETYGRSDGKDKRKHVPVWKYTISENETRVYYERHQMDIKSRSVGDQETIYYKGKNAVIKTNIISKILALFLVAVCAVSMVVMGFILTSAFYVA